LASKNETEAVGGVNSATTPPNQQQSPPANQQQSPPNVDGVVGDHENPQELKLEDFPDPPKVVYIKDYVTMGTVGIKIKGKFPNMKNVAYV